jgi:signal-transduction protein with cAMP-binding, CBS, and nucleotidyltransferase domain
MDSGKKAKVIECFPMFNGVSRKLLSYLDSLQVKKYCKNELIYRRRSEPEGVYLILKGEVRLEERIEVKEGRGSRGMGSELRSNRYNL